MEESRRQPFGAKLASVRPPAESRLRDVTATPSPAPASTPAPTKFHAGGLVNGAVVLGLLYFGREVLVPITLAVILSLLLAPLVRKLRRFVRSQVTGGAGRGDRDDDLGGRGSRR